MNGRCCVRGKVKFTSFKSTAASFDWGFCTLHLSVYLQCLPHPLIVSIPLFSNIKLFVALRNVISNRGKKLHCRTTLIGINAQLLPFKCITDRWQKVSATFSFWRSHKSYSAHWQCCLHNRLRMDRYPHVGGEKDIYRSGPVPYALWVDCVLVLCVRVPVYECVYDGLVSPRCRLLK